MRVAGPEELVALRSKYERMLSLREAHDRARRDPSFVEPDPRAELTRLAAEFPGALREIDRLSLDVIRARISALASAADDPTRAEAWMSAQVVFHRHARGALVAKRWLAGRKAITETERASFGTEVAGLPRAAEALLFVDALDRIANPPHGRLMGFVFERVALVLERTPAEVRALVFGLSVSPTER